MSNDDLSNGYAWDIHEAIIPQPSKKKIFTPIFTAFIVIVLGVGGFFLFKSLTKESDLIKEAATKCNLVSNLSDNDKSISIDTQGSEEISGDSFVNVVCLLAELNIPDSIVTRIDHTRALDGMQGATWDDFTANWTYHPDDGLFIVISTK